MSFHRIKYILLKIKYELKKLTEDSLYKIKSSRAIRIIFYPLMLCLRKAQQKKFAASGDSKRLLQFKNSHKGEKCFIIGNGPSLRPDDLEKISSYITFASNRIYNIFGLTSWRPDYYVAFEPTFTKDNIDIISQLEVRKAKFVNVCARSNQKICDQETHRSLYWIYSSQKYTIDKETTKGIDFSTDISQYLGASYSVTFTILQIAVYMGFKEIYLLGMDHYSTGENTHFYHKNIAEYATPTYLEGIEYGYILAKHEAENRGIHIYNATRGGKLEVFPRVDFDSLF